jgi:hypothetical protein
MNLPVWVRPAAAVVVLGSASALGYWLLYAKPRNDLRQQLDRHLSANATYEAYLRDRRHVADELKAVAATTLGAKEDEVVARFRTALGEIAEKDCGLTGVNVNTRKPVDVPDPAGVAPRLLKPTGLRQALKKQRDFAVIEGDLEGHGRLDQVLKAAAMVQAQPWVHRVSSFSIKPEGRERDRFELKMGIATILMPPDLAPKGAPDVPIRTLDAAAPQQWASIVEKNVFKEPSAVAHAPAPAAHSAPPPPPYNDWRLTGVVESRLGIEAFLLNVKTQQRLTLPVGSAVADARFVSGAGERAVFEIGGQTYEVSNGQTLEQRRPTQQ